MKSIANAGVVTIVLLTTIVLLGATAQRKAVTTSSTSNLSSRLASLESKVAALQQENAKLRSVIKISSNGNTVTVESPYKLYLKSPQIEVQAQANLKLRSGGAAELRSSSVMTIKGSLVKVN